MARRLVPIAALCALFCSGCYGDFESFAVGKAKQDCKRIQECNRSAFVNDHNDDMGRCREDWEDFYFDLADGADRLGWDYEPELGRECVAVSRDLRRDCSSEAANDIRDACDDVFWDGF